MKLIQASQLSDARFNQFVNLNDHIEKEALRKNGYVVEINGELCGCFQLEEVAQKSYWLKQLYIVKKEAKRLPVLLEVVLLFVKNKDGKRVYAHSQQPVTDLLLYSLHFSLQHERRIKFHHSHKKGHWWLYNVS